MFVCNISMDKNISCSCVTNVRTLHTSFIISVFNGSEVRIENSVTTVTVQHHEACRVMPTVILSEGTFNLHQRTIMDIFFLHTFPSTIAFRLEYVFVYQFYAEQK